MATEFLQSSLLSRPYVLTSWVRSIIASTDEEKLSVSLACSGAVFFSVELYAYDGKVELFDPGSIIEQYFIANGLICENITVVFGDASLVLRCLFCEYVMPESFSTQKSFLVSSSVRMVHRGSSLSISAIPDQDYLNIEVSVVGRDAYGAIASVSFSQTLEPSESLSSRISVADIIQKATGLQSVAPPISNPLKDVMYFAVTLGQRQLMCYLSNSQKVLTFRFRNIFNVLEYLDIEGDMTEKSETSYQSAVCSGDIVQYDRVTDRTYGFSSGPIDKGAYDSLSQLFASHSAEILFDGAFRHIVFTEHDCKYSSADDSIDSVNFTWRFIGRRPVIFNSSIFGVLKDDVGIFTDEYTLPYE